MRLRTLCIDIGGSRTKARVFDARGNALSDRFKIETPHRMKTSTAFAIIEKLASEMPAFDRISVGFPGVVKDGRTWTATNLGAGWKGFDLGAAIEREFRLPARVANDADVQGLAVVQGRGIELLLTFGTGLGSALFHQGILIPNFQLGHHPLDKDGSYECLLGKRGLLKSGEREWNRKIRKAIGILSKVFNWDSLYLGGGEAGRIQGCLPANVRVVSNENGLLGGVKLWELPGIHLEKDKREIGRTPRQRVAA
jgi:polyphosphate glucokinase